MNIEKLFENRELIETIYKAKDELESVRTAGHQMMQKRLEESEKADKLQQEVNVLKRFIVDHVSEDEQKLIFKDKSE